MKNKAIVWSAIGLSALLGACSTVQEETLRDESKSLTFTSNILNPATRVTNGEWDKQDGIGIYALDANTSDAIYRNSENVAYEAQSSGATVSFVHALSNDGIELDGKSAIDIYAYYPYQEGLEGNQYGVDLRTITPESDFLYSNNVKEIRDTESPHLYFTHQLAKFELVLSIDPGATNTLTSLADLAVHELNGLLARAGFDLLTGTFVSSGAEGEMIETIKPIFNVSEDKQTATVTAFVLPLQKSEDIEIPLILDDETILWKPTTSLEFTSGKRYIFKVGLKKEDKLTLVNPEASIKDWEVGHEDKDPVAEKPFLKVKDTNLTCKEQGEIITIDVDASNGLNWNVSVDEDINWIKVNQQENAITLLIDGHYVTSWDRSDREGLVTLEAEGVDPVAIHLHQKMDATRVLSYVENFGKSTTDSFEPEMLSGMYYSVGDLVKLADRSDLGKHLYMPYDEEASWMKIDQFHEQDAMIELDWPSPARLEFIIYPEGAFDFEDFFIDAESLETGESTILHIDQELVPNQMNKVVIDNLDSKIETLSFVVKSKKKGAIRLTNIRLSIPLN